MGWLRWNRSSRAARGLEGRLAGPLLGEDDLAGDGNGQRVAGSGLDDVEDRFGRRAQGCGQPGPGGPAQVLRRLAVAHRLGRCRPAEQTRQVGIAVLHSEGVVEDRSPRRAGIEHSGGDRVVIPVRRLRLQQGACQAGLAQRRVELACPE